VAETVSQLFANWAAVFAASALVGGVIVAMVTIWGNHQDATAATTFRYLERQDEARFTRHIMAARKVWKLAPSEAKANGEARYTSLSYYQMWQLFRVLNFYEELCTLYHHHQFNKAVFDKELAPYVIVYWLEAHWLINLIRTSSTGERNWGMWEEWETATRHLIDSGVSYQPTVDSDPYSARPPRK
jgi:hypothetical protein